MDAWWRTEPLKAEEADLLEALLRAHHQSSFRDNASSAAVANAASGSADVGKAIAAAILTLGGKHAPLEQTVEFLGSLRSPADQVSRLLKFGTKIPGWGGTFQKDEPDPIWQEVDLLLRRLAPELSVKLAKVSAELARHGYNLYPNPSAYTAAAALFLGVPAKLAVYLFIAGRVNAWAQIAAGQILKEEYKN
jgi:citrate synthase